MITLTLTLLAAQAPAPAAGLPIHDPATTAGMRWADYDADGFADAAALAPGGEVRLLRNLGDGTLEDVTALAGLPAGLRAAVALWGDYDGDGALDLYLGSLDGDSRLFRQTHGAFQDVTERVGLDPAVAARAAQWIDYDGDRTADLHLSTAGGEVLYRGLGGTAFERVALGLPGAPTASVAGVSARAPGAPARPAAPGADGRDRSAPDPSGSGGRVAMGTVGTVTRGPSGSTAALGTGVCVDGLVDQNGGSCMNASSTPTVGMLYPLGTDFFIEPGTGEVGIGTTSPTDELDVVGGIRSRGVDGGSLTAFNPDNQSASAKLDWLSNQARIRVGGSGSGAQNGLAIQTTGDTTLMRIQHDGKVGIGTTAPVTRLQVDEDGTEDLLRLRTSGQTKVIVRNNGFVGISDVLFFPSARLDVTSTGSERAFEVNDGEFIVDAQGEVGIGTANPTERFFINATQDFSVDDDGDVQVGTSGFAARLAIAGNGTKDLIRAISGSNRLTLDSDANVGLNTTAPQVKLHVASGTDVSPSGGGYLQLGNQNGQNIAIDSNEIMARSNGSAADLNLNVEGGDVLMLTNSSAVGRVGIGTASPQKLLHVDGDIQCVLLSQTSDARFKTDVRDLDGALEAVAALRGVRYTWDAERYPQGGAGEQLGFLAQEVRQVLPEVVSENDDGYLAVSYSAVVPVLAEAVAELRAEKDAEIAALRAELERRDDTVADLTERLTRFEEQLAAALAR